MHQHFGSGGAGRFSLAARCGRMIPREGQGVDGRRALLLAEASGGRRCPGGQAVGAAAGRTSAYPRSGPSKPMRKHGRCEE